MMGSLYMRLLFLQSNNLLDKEKIKKREMLSMWRGRRRKQPLSNPVLLRRPTSRLWQTIEILGRSLCSKRRSWLIRFPIATWIIWPNSSQITSLTNSRSTRKPKQWNWRSSGNLSKRTWPFLILILRPFMRISGGSPMDDSTSLIALKKKAPLLSCMVRYISHPT